MRPILIILRGFLLVLPWALRRRMLTMMFGYDIHPGAHIGFSLILCRKLTMAEGARIGHFNVIRELDQVQLGLHSTIGHFNWVGGVVASQAFFADEDERISALILGHHAAVTSSHRFDCTNRVEVGDYSIIAGHRSEIVTHGINIYSNRQESKPVVFGKYCYVGTGMIALKGSVLPDYCVVAAGSVLNKPYTQSYAVYSGVPAEAVRDLPHDAKYFSRDSGIVY